MPRHPFDESDALGKALNEEFMWEFHPFLPLKRSHSILARPEPAVLYRPTAVDEMWLFFQMDILPIDNITERIEQRNGQTMAMLPHNNDGLRWLRSQGYKLDPRGLRADAKKATPQGE